jgi:uncharacterized protein with FMN-binding domain
MVYVCCAAALAGLLLVGGCAAGDADRSPSVAAGPDGAGAADAVEPALPEIGSVDLSQVPDGTYMGETTYKTAWVGAEVTVLDHAITRITVMHSRARGKYAKRAEAVAERVLRRQSVEVHAYTGATSSSTLILKAIEKALARQRTSLERGGRKLSSKEYTREGGEEEQQ